MSPSVLHAHIYMPVHRFAQSVCVFATRSATPGLLQQAAAGGGGGGGGGRTSKRAEHRLLRPALPPLPAAFVPPHLPCLPPAACSSPTPTPLPPFFSCLHHTNHQPRGQRRGRQPACRRMATRIGTLEVTREQRRGWRSGAGEGRGLTLPACRPPNLARLCEEDAESSQPNLFRLAPSLPARGCSVRRHVLQGCGIHG